MRHVMVIVLGLAVIAGTNSVSAEEPSLDVDELFRQIETGEAYEGFTFPLGHSWPRTTQGKCECPPGFDCSDLGSKHADGCPVPGMDWKFWAVSSALIGTTVLDIESTFYARDRCPGCYEGNPAARLLVNRGKGVPYAFSMSIHTVSLYGSYRLRKEGHWWWWLPAVSASVARAWVTHHNYGLPR